MAVFTLEQIEAANPQFRAPGFSTVDRSIATTEEEFAAQRKRAAEVATRSVLGASFEEDNFVGSFFARRADVGQNVDTGDNFNVVDYIKKNSLQGYEDEFMGAVNEKYANGLAADIRRKETNKETTAAAGWAGTFASIAAGTLDLPSLIPGGGIVRGAKGGYSVAKTALLGSSLAAVGAGVQEFGLQQTQTGRTAEESYVNLGASILLGGLIGGAAAAAMSKGERKAAEAAMGRLYDMTEPGGAIRLGPNKTQGVGAEVNPDIEPDIFDLVERADLDVEGKVAAGAVKATHLISPVLRATQHPSGAARQYLSTLYENVIERSMHKEGRSLGQSPETMINIHKAKDTEFQRQFEVIYKEMVTAGTNMSKDDFANLAGRALFDGDVSDNPFVAKLAKAQRDGVINPLTSEALRTKRSDGSALLTEEDLGKLAGDKSYGPRIYNQDTLRGKMAEWNEYVGRKAARQMEEAHGKDVEALNARLDGYKTQIEDLQTAGSERAAKIGEVEALGDKLDSEFADVADLADDLTEATAAQRAAETTVEKQAAQLAAKEARDKGGERLQEYLKRRAELRRRKRNLTRDNADAQSIKRAKLEDRMDEVRAADASAVKVFARRLKNIIAQIDRNLPGRAQELLDSATAEVERLNKLMAASEKRVAKLAQEPGEQPAGLAAYVAGERAAAEAASRAARDLVDQLQDIAARGVTDADYEDLRLALDIKPVSSRGERLAKAEANKSKRAEKLDAAEKEVTDRQLELSKAQQMARDLNEKLNAVAEGVSARSMRRGEYLQRAKDRAAKLTPGEVAAQSAARIDTLKARRAAAEARHYEKWVDNPGNDAPQFAKQAERYPFEHAGRNYAQQMYDSITGRVARNTELPPGVVKFAAGPLKGRGIQIPSSEMASMDWLETDIRAMSQRHTRAMAAEIELTHKFGRADMAEQLQTVAAEYAEMHMRVANAGSVEEINKIIGKEKFKTSTDLAAAKTHAENWLTSSEKWATQDMREGRDLMRGDFRPETNQDWASVSRSVRGINFILRMGGAALASVAETVRPAMVHGLTPALKGLPKALGGGTGKTARTFLIEEAKRSNLISERIAHSVMAANADLGDPFATKVSRIESLIQKGTAFGSRWNGLAMLTDWQQGYSSIVSQHRIIETVMDRAGEDGSFVRTGEEGTRLLAVLGIDNRTRGMIKEMIERHGEVVDGVQVPHTNRWVKGAAVGEDTRIAEKAERAYLAALNLDVNSIISRRGLGDAPLMINTPGGAALLQFSGYGLGAHSRVMIRGLQGPKQNFISGLVAMSAIGGFTAWVGSYRTIDWETGARQREKWTENPATLLAEALDRSGIFPLMFDLSNRAERLSGAAGPEYRFNPIKSTISGLTGGPVLGEESSRASSATGVYSGIGGPTVGLIEGLVSTGRVAADAATRALGGEAKTPKRDTERMLATIPYNSYLGARQISQWLFEYFKD